jgi:hypothetical protein
MHWLIISTKVTTLARGGSRRRGVSAPSLQAQSSLVLARPVNTGKTVLYRTKIADDGAAISFVLVSELILKQISERRHQVRTDSRLVNATMRSRFQ